MTACTLAAVLMLGCSGADTAREADVARTPAATDVPAADEPIGTADGGATSTPAVAPVQPAPSTPAVTPGNAGAALGAPTDPMGDVRRVTVSEARDAMSSGSAMMIDVRSPQAFAESHIPGAVNIPLDQMPSRVMQLPRDKQIITYCT